jgi:hypothetical protein
VSFLAPWALLLAAAAGVPLVLHLLRRRTGTRFDFPAVRYLLRAERERAREVRLRNLLLMLLRIGAVLALAFAASRPIGPLPGLGHAPAAVAIVLDNSRSTSAAGADGPVQGALVSAARAVVDAAGAADRLWIVTFDGAVTGGTPDALRDALSRLRVLDGAGDPEAALRRAAALVRSSGIPAGRMVVVTDGQASTWANVDAGAADGVVVTVHRPAGEPPVNRYVAAVATEPAHWDPRGAVRASIVGGDSTTWRVVLDGRTAARGSALPGATVIARVQPATRGWIAGAIELAPDELRGDDVRHFAAHVGDPPAIAVDGASGPFLRGAAEALVLAGRAVRGDAVLLASAERARRPALLFAPADPLRLADADRALERAGVPWRFGARREGPAPLSGGGLDGAVARHWFPLLATAAATGARADTLVRVGGEPWAVAGDGYVLVASAATAEATDLTVRAAFVPWLDALLSQRLAQGTGAAMDAAPGATVRVPTGVDGLEAPDGGVTAVRPGADLVAPWTAGVHFWRRGDTRAGALVVNGEPAESELARLDAGALAAVLGAAAPMPDGAALARDAFASGGRRALDGTFLILALGLLAAESLVARRVRLKPAAA